MGAREYGYRRDLDTVSQFNPYSRTRPP